MFYEEDVTGFGLEDLADAEQAQQVAQAQGQQPQATAPGVVGVAQQVLQQIPVVTQQWQQWDQQRRAGNIQPIPQIPTPQHVAAQSFPWTKVLVGAGIAAAVVAGVMIYKKKSRGKASNPGKQSGSWYTIGD